MSNHLRRALAAACVLAAAVTTGCATSAPPADIVAHGTEALPAQSIQDLVTYGDVLVEFSVLSEARLPAPAEEVARGEGLIERTVAIEFGTVRWTRPTDRRKVALPQGLELADGGWVFHGQKEARLRLADRPTLEPGQRYLGVFSYGKLWRSPSWFALYYTPLATGRVVRVDSDRPANRQMAGQSTPDVAKLFASSAPDAKAAPFMDADPVQRWARVDRAR